MRAILRAELLRLI